MRAFVRRTLALAMVVMVLAGCVPGPGTPAPTFQCTGVDPDGPKTPCSQEEFDAQQKTYYLEREAMIVYEKYWAEMVKLLEEGAPADAALRLNPYLDDPALGVTVDLLRHSRESGMQPSQVKHSLKMRPARVALVEGSIVAIVGCEDTRGSTFPYGGGVTTHGSLVQTTRHFKRVDGRLKHFNVSAYDEVEQCDE